MSKKLSTNLYKIRKSSRQHKLTAKAIARSDTNSVIKGLVYVLRDVLMNYQLKFITDESQVIVISKGRQIGFSWTMCLYSILKCLQGYNVYYNSYNERSGKLFLSIAAKYTHEINEKIATMGISPIANYQEIIANSITFNNLCKLTVLTGDETNFRGITGYKTIVINDEVAHRDNVAEKLKAVIGITMWGGKVLIASTHNGKHHDFNKLCLDVQSGKKPYSYHFVPIDKAMEDGLVKKICGIQKISWSEEYEKQWLQELIDFYGDDADEELFGIPKENSKGSNIIISSNFKYLGEEYLKKVTFSIRYWDFASSISKNSYYTASVLLSYIDEIQTVLITGYTLDKCRPLDVIEKVKQIVIMDGYNTTNVLEREPGSSGDLFVESMISNHLLGYPVDSYQPRLKKEVRLFPVGQHLKSGKLKILTAVWNEEFINWVSQFDGESRPGTNDLCDCLSGGIDYMKLHGVL